MQQASSPVPSTTSSSARNATPTELATITGAAAPNGTSPEARARSLAATGSLFAIVAYLCWGLVALYWKALGPVPSLEVLAHRVVWSLVVAVLALTALRRWPAALAVLRDGRRLRLMALSTALLSFNWGVFIWAVQAGRLLDSSLGYYINPLVNVALGVVLLGERLRPLQRAAVALAGAGVLYLAVSKGVLPWIPLALAISFALYGLVRKLAPVDALSGLFVETLLVFPIAAAYVVARESAGVGALTVGTPAHGLLLSAAGIITAVPLLCFTGAARRLPLSTLGFFQYLSPTCQLLLAVALYEEPFTRAHAITFACIWAALVLFSVEALRRLRPPPA